MLTQLPHVIPMRTRRWFSIAFLIVGFLAGFAAAIWSSNGREIPNVESLVLSFVVIAFAAILWLQPRPLVYALAVLSVILAFVGFWLASPDGGRWTASSIFHDSSYGPYGGRWFVVLFVVFFPLGWLLLAASVTKWKIGLVAYVLAGLVFVSAIAAWFGVPVVSLTPQIWVVLRIVLIWPYYTLIIPGAFGHTFG